MSEKCTNFVPRQEAGCASRNLGPTVERSASGSVAAERINPPQFSKVGHPPTPVVSPLVRAFHTFFEPQVVTEGD
jgi:hypothetical protein